MAKYKRPVFFLLSAAGAAVAAASVYQLTAPLRVPVFEKLVIAIAPLGKVDSAFTAEVSRALGSAYHADVLIVPESPLPEDCYYAPRSRYRADKLLDFLEKTRPDGATHIVGLTEVDISTSKLIYPDWGVFGLSRLGRRAAVISPFRLRQSAEGGKLTERLQKTAVHELGHCLGLAHCPDTACIMRDAESKAATLDAVQGSFCSVCRTFLAEHIKAF